MNSYYDDYSGYQPMLSSSMEISLYRNKDMQESESGYHDFFEMVFLIDGNVRFDIEEKQYHMNREDIFLLPPGIFHREIPGSGYYERIILRLNPWYLNRLSTRQTNLASCFAAAGERGYCVTFDPLVRHRIRTMLYELLRETRAKEFGKDILMESELKTLLIMLNRYQSLNIRTEAASEQESGKNITEILQYINHHYTDSLTLDQLCDTFYISKFYLSRSFERLTKKSIYQYIQEKRMTMARQLLLSGERPTDIYRICGFSSYSNFYRAFRKYFGISPREYICRITHIDSEAD